MKTHATHSGLDPESSDCQEPWIVQGAKVKHNTVILRLYWGIQFFSLFCPIEPGNDGDREAMHPCGKTIGSSSSSKGGEGPPGEEAPRGREPYSPF